jgi:hypothetical protein
VIRSPCRPPRSTEQVNTPVLLRFTAEDVVARTPDTCRETVGSIVKQIEREVSTRYPSSCSHTFEMKRTDSTPRSWT